MLTATVLIMTTARFFPERPAGSPNLRDIVPGLIFIDPANLSDLLRTNFGAMEGAFWSLYVEAKFYCIFGFMYFWQGRRTAIAALAVLALASLAGTIGQEFGVASAEIIKLKVSIDNYFISEYLGFFLTGIFGYLYLQDKKRIYLGASLISGISSELFWLTTKGGKIALICILALFLSALTITTVQVVLRSKLILLLGFISYPLYLIHENAGVALIVKFGRFIPAPYEFVAALLAASIVAALALIIARTIEPALRHLFKRRVLVHLPTLSKGNKT